jgi:S1-C subfamily serine protease
LGKEEKMQNSQSIAQARLSLWTIVLSAMLSITVAATGIAQAAERPNLDIKSIIKKVRKGVIRVEVLEVGSPVASAGFGGGSGFVFEVDYDKGIAYALTNHHVAGQASAVGVTFWDGAQYPAELVKAEPGIDVALIKIRGIPDERSMSESEKTIVPVVLGDSDQVQPGDLGVAMGNPGASDAAMVDRSNPYADFLLDQTANVNVVSGRDNPLDFPVGIWAQNRNGLGWQYGTNFDYAFRMTTPINGGNSGGPLFNNKGEVIGINFYGGSSAITQASNHAIPINLAKDFAFQVLETGKFEKPWLGLDIIFPSYVRDPDKYVEFRERFRPKHREVFGVRRGSPAEAAGLEKGDIIVDINGQHFKEPEDVRQFVFGLDIGTPLSIRVIRNGRQLNDPIRVSVGVKRSYDSEFSV